MREIEALKARLFMLERTQRRWRLATLAVGLGLLALVLVGAASGPTTFDDLSVRTLVVRDDAGTPRVTIEGGASKGVGPRLRFLDSAHRTRGSWTMSGSATVFSLTGADGGTVELKGGTFASVAVSDRDGRTLYEVASRKPDLPLMPTDAR